ncbi:MAG: hypothetical protein OK457_00190 [Thaumarchaeota archaeon]|nr:hypothetical protein [Nitrososphaerota archaeon]
MDHDIDSGTSPQVDASDEASIVQLPKELHHCECIDEELLEMNEEELNELEEDEFEEDEQDE